jgi:mitochondrial fission protein ELM1
MSRSKTVSRQPAFPQPDDRDAPTLVRLDPRPGAPPSNKPPVRLFLGSEDAQHRAERIFFYALERARDPGRAYDIHVMKRLSGFDRRGWRTGFTNYRFAIPDFAGRGGRAIYNDADQIYLTDPGALFDLELGDKGYLAVAAGDTSVMLMDCARMADLWNLAAARAGGKQSLLAAAADRWGRLDPAWNARDGEYEPGKSRLLHFTAMHTQPWQPFPEAYAYRRHPFAELWLGLEREADEAGYQVFTAERPSPHYGPALERLRAKAGGERDSLGDGINRFLAACGAGGAIAIAAGAPAPAPTASLPVMSFDLADSGGAWPTGQADAVLAFRLLERLPPEDLPWTLERLFGSARRCVAAIVRDGRPAAWWQGRFAAVAARHPDIAWRLETADHVVENDGPARFAATPPRVWVLLGHRAGDRAQLLALAEALGWPFEIKELRYGWRHRLPNRLQGACLASLDRAAGAALEPPWPDLVLDCGKRSVPIARWIERQSRGRARLVHLGRPWGRFDWFDLIVTTPQYRIAPRPNIQINAVPLNRLPARDIAAAADRWRERFAQWPRPWIGLIVGGGSAPLAFDADTARRLGKLASDAAKAAGGSLLLTTSPRTGDVAAEALIAAIHVPAFIHRWTSGGGDNPYPAILGLADRFIVTGESASMLAEACATGRPVAIFDLPRRPGPSTRLLDAIERLAGDHGGRASYRGTPQQQDRIARLHDRLIERGWFMPLRDFRAYQDGLVARGWAERLGERNPALERAPQDDLARTVERIRRLLYSDGRRLPPGE